MSRFIYYNHLEIRMLSVYDADLCKSKHDFIFKLISLKMCDK